MKKIAVLGAAAAMTLNAAGIDTLLGSGKLDGQIRLGYVDQNNVVSDDTYATAIGGILRYESGEWNGFKAGVAGYGSQRIGFASGDGVKRNLDFLDPTGHSIAYVGEGYVDYSAADFNLRIGRQVIDTPFADSDDIRMLPNSFEAAIATYSGIENTTITGGYVKRWAGYDSGGDISDFKKLAPGSDGAAVAGIVYDYSDEMHLQGWYYGIDKVADAWYADGVKAWKMTETVQTALAVQYAGFSEKNNSGIDGSVYGIGLDASVGMVTLSLVYNQAFNGANKSVSNGFGGGPYFTSMEEMTIDGMEDAKAYVAVVGLDMGEVGLEGLTLDTGYGTFKSKPMNASVSEWDIIASYEMNEAVSGDISFAKINDRNNNFDAGADAGYSRFMARINYCF